MVDLAKLPVSKSFKVFWKYKENLLFCAQDNPKLLTFRWSNPEPLRSLNYNIRAHPFCAFMSESDILKCRKTGNHSYTPKEIKAKWGDDGQLIYSIICLTEYIPSYLQYQMYADEINNAVILHLKADAIGRLEFGRAKKEVLKICKRNDLGSMARDDGYGSLYILEDHALEIICGTIAMKNREKSIQKPSNDGLAFEGLCREKLNELGYSTLLTKQSGDFGCDILAEKEDIVYAVQCKYTSSKIGVKAVQEAASARKYYKADIAVVITNGEYTSAANELAVENKVVIINVNQIPMLENLSL